MSKIAVVYWSGTGNTEQMANAVAEGAKEAGAEVSTLTADQFSAAKGEGIEKKVDDFAAEVAAAAGLAK